MSLSSWVHKPIYNWLWGRLTKYGLEAKSMGNNSYTLFSPKSFLSIQPSKSDLPGLRQLAHITNLTHTGLSWILPDPIAIIIFTGKHRTPGELHVEKFITEIGHQLFFFVFFLI